ncbi:S-adenosylmethionine-dependent carboxyl methyltransferase [Roseiarcus fermentans]|uniref:S-adenosylmethionine-dependent carboxyl methyltransferase n=1 Tax=Roseiarcus fermentans TaxID=1473586 RepID=A0A366FV25_9HYPH|nr:SAM-dependent methyltransferase [Roseiarcus fermentans]RBP18361.1 S-adenosylmethionine-dependent carboxyl methyltransferase [Roseiarcus fermentans]
MGETPAAVQPMEGHGAYNRGSRLQAAGLVPAIALFEEAARAASLAETIVIVDYGASEGRNSLAPIAGALRALRARVGAARAINVVHTDLPGNDFSALFETLNNDPQSYLKEDPAAFACAVGRSYFEQLLPDASVTLGWSSWAIQWLSRVPAPIPDQVQVACSRDADARVAFARQAAEDWRAFLLRRGRELRAGGRLVVLTMATDDDGRFGYAPLLDALYATLVGMAGDGFLAAEELRRMAIPTVGRGRAEFVEPFAADGHLAGLALERLEIFEGEDRFWQDYQRTGDAVTFGAQWARFSRASVFPTLAAALHPAGDAGRIADFCNRLEAGMARRLAAAPERMTIPLAKLALVKADAPARS